MRRGTLHLECGENKPNKSKQMSPKYPRNDPPSLRYGAAGEIQIIKFFSAALREK
jgi:hypothetical protein